MTAFGLLAPSSNVISSVSWSIKVSTQTYSSWVPSADNCTYTIDSPYSSFKIGSDFTGIIIPRSIPYKWIYIYAVYMVTPHNYTNHTNIQASINTVIPKIVTDFTLGSNMNKAMIDMYGVDAYDFGSMWIQKYYPNLASTEYKEPHITFWPQIYLSSVPSVGFTYMAQISCFLV